MVSCSTIRSPLVAYVFSQRVERNNPHGEHGDPFPPSVVTLRQRFALLPTEVSQKGHDNRSVNGPCLELPWARSGLRGQEADESLVETRRIDPGKEVSQLDRAQGSS